MRKCTTVTVKRQRHEFLKTRIRSMAVFLWQLLHDMFHDQGDVVATCITFKKDAENKHYNIFYNSVKDQYKNVEEMLQLLAQATVDFLEYHDVCRKYEFGYLANPVYQLWEYLLCVVYETPDVMRTSTANIKHVRTSLDTFVDVSLDVDFSHQSLFNVPTCEEPKPQQAVEDKKPETQQGILKVVV